MKGVALALTALFVGTLANPSVPVLADSREQRLVTGQIIQAIEDAAQSIRDAGLDPFDYDGTAAYELPVPVLLAANAFVDRLSFNGLSNIAVNRMDYSLLNSRLTFDVSLPRLSLVVHGSGYDVTFFGKKYVGSAVGNIAITQPRLAGQIRVSIGIISGISIRSVSLTFSLGSIESNMNVNLFGVDLSNDFNTFLRATIPDTLNAFAAEINELLEIVAWDVLDSVL